MYTFMFPARSGWLYGGDKQTRRIKSTGGDVTIEQLQASCFTIPATFKAWPTIKSDVSNFEEREREKHFTSKFQAYARLIGWSSTSSPNESIAEHTSWFFVLTTGERSKSHERHRCDITALYTAGAATTYGFQVAMLPNREGWHASMHMIQVLLRRPCDIVCHIFRRGFADCLREYWSLRHWRWLPCLTDLLCEDMQAFRLVVVLVVINGRQHRHDQNMNHIDATQDGQSTDVMTTHSAMLSTTRHAEMMQSRQVAA